MDVVTPRVAHFQENSGRNMPAGSILPYQVHSRAFPLVPEAHCFEKTVPHVMFFTMKAILMNPDKNENRDW
jgi:hypothetical protein